MSTSGSNKFSNSADGWSFAINGNTITARKNGQDVSVVSDETPKSCERFGLSGSCGNVLYACGILVDDRRPGRAASVAARPRDDAEPGAAVGDANGDQQTGGIPWSAFVAQSLECVSQLDRFIRGVTPDQYEKIRTDLAQKIYPLDVHNLLVKLSVPRVQSSTRTSWGNYKQIPNTPPLHQNTIEFINKLADHMNKNHWMLLNKVAIGYDNLTREPRAHKYATDHLSYVDTGNAINDVDLRKFNYLAERMAKMVSNGDSARRYLIGVGRVMNGGAPEVPANIFESYDVIDEKKAQFYENFLKEIEDKLATVNKRLKDGDKQAILAAINAYRQSAKEANKLSASLYVYNANGLVRGDKKAQEITFKNIDESNALHAKEVADRQTAAATRAETKVVSNLSKLKDVIMKLFSQLGVGVVAVRA